MIGVAARRVSVDLGGARVLEDVDLTVAPGEWVGLIGPNGAGKTTLLRALLGAVVASGEVVVGDTPVSLLGRRQRARLLASVPQRPRLPPDMTVGDYVLLGRTPYISYLGTERSRDLDAAADALRFLDLTALEARRLGSLSGGEQQRAVLARALAQQAPVLLLDEPTSALDVGHQQQVMELVGRLHASRGMTLVSAIHDLTIAAQFCDRLVLLAGGRVVASGVAGSVLTEPIIREHYGARVRVLDDGEGGIVVIPMRQTGLGRSRGAIISEGRA